MILSPRSLTLQVVLNSSFFTLLSAQPASHGVYSQHSPLNQVSPLSGWFHLLWGQASQLPKQKLPRFSPVPLTFVPLSKCLVPLYTELDAVQPVSPGLQVFTQQIIL